MTLTDAELRTILRPHTGRFGSPIGCLLPDAEPNPDQNQEP